MLEVLFTQDSKVEDLFCGASSGSEPSLFFSNYLFSLGFKLIRMTDEAYSSAVQTHVIAFVQLKVQTMGLGYKFSQH